MTKIKELLVSEFVQTHMLDFYKISEGMPKPDWPEKAHLERVGGLKIEAFEDLRSRGLIEQRFDFWTDFRLSARSTLALHNLMLAKYPQLREEAQDLNFVTQFFRMVENAAKHSMGLVAYAD